jgi:hypothetical protein
VLLPLVALPLLPRPRGTAVSGVAAATAIAAITAVAAVATYAAVASAA